MKKVDFVKLAASVIIFLVVGLAGLGIARLTVGAELYKQIFRLVILPICAFVSGFVSLIVLKKAAECFLVSLFADAVIYLIVLGFSLWVLLWNLLYVFSSFIGLAIAYIILTHKKQQNQIR